MVYIVGVGGTLRHNSRSQRALQVALEFAEAEGAETEMLSLYELDLPMFYPDKAKNDYGENVQRLLTALRRADGVLFSTGAYHGILAGVTKNMLDFVELMHEDEIPFLYNRAVGLIATAGGAMADVYTIDSLIHTIHALRGIVVPLTVPIPSAGKVFKEGAIVDESVVKKLQQFAHETVRITRALHPTKVQV
jgi:FMN reductase